MHVWKYATLSVMGPLLSVDVAVCGATTETTSVKFVRIHRDCGTQINQPRWCPECKVFLEADETLRKVKGTDAIVYEDEYNEAVGEKVPLVPVTKFVPWAVTGTYPSKKVYFLEPPKVDLLNVYPLLVQTMLECEVDGFGHANLGGRDKPFFVRAIGGRLQLDLIYSWHELKQPDFEPPQAKFTEQARKLARTIVKSGIEPLDDEFDLASEPEASLQALVAAKVAGNPPPIQEAEEKPEAAPDLMTALKETYRELVAA